MDIIADLLLAVGALGAAIYCAVLARRLSRFTDLEKGMGGAIAVLSVQVDDMTKALSGAQVSASGSGKELESLVERAEAAARQLEIMMASLHDLPDVTAVAQNGGAPGVKPTNPMIKEPTRQFGKHIGSGARASTQDAPPLQWKRRHFGVAAE